MEQFWNVIDLSCWRFSPWSQASYELALEIAKLFVKKKNSMLKDMKVQMINEMKASTMFSSSGWVSRCYFLCSVACFWEIYSFRINESGVPVLGGTANYNKCRCCGEVNLFWFCRVAMDICNNGAPAMMGSHSGFQKQFKNLLLKQKVHCQTDVCSPAKLYLLLWKMCWTPW